MWHKSEYYYYILYIKLLYGLVAPKEGQIIIYYDGIDEKDEINKKYFLWAMGCIMWHKSEYYYYILYIKLL